VARKVVPKAESQARRRVTLLPNRRLARTGERLVPKLRVSMLQAMRPPLSSGAIYVALEPPLLLEAQHIAALTVPNSP
jgi:hypothetical protein